MTRNHRTAHRFFWPALGVVIAFALLMALVLRPLPAQGALSAPAQEATR